MSNDIPSTSLLEDDSTPLLDDTTQGTPLDLLLNAISGGQQYPYTSQDDQSLQGLLEADPFLADDLISNEMVLGYEDDSADASSSGLPLKTVMSHTGASTSTTSRPNITDILRKGEEGFSKIEVWHPNTGQKSYGKERRMLNPPPVLRVSGPLFPHLTSVTLTSMTSPTPRADLSNSPASEMSHQTHLIPLNPAPVQSMPYDIYTLRNRKTIKAAERHNIQSSAIRSGFAASLPHLRSVAGEKAREDLGDGLSFPGLWVGEGVGKGKEFKLELRLGQPGVEVEKRENSPSKDIVARNHANRTAGNEGQDLLSADIQDNEKHENDEKHEDTINLDTSEPTLATATSSTSSLPPTTQTPRSWATLHSSPLSIVSKPSQKTAKARSMSSCLTTSSPIALWVRINSQTVRTKYMKVSPSTSITDTHDLTAKTGKWTPFRFEVITRVPPPTQFVHRRGRYSTDDEDVASNVLTYGSVVVLVDLQSGVRSEKVKLVRVDRGEVVLGDDAGCPVSELQRVGFLRVQDGQGQGQGQDEGGGRWYLSAPGARSGGGEMLPPGTGPSRKRKADSSSIDPDTLDGVHSAFGGLGEDGSEVVKVKKRKTKRNALAMAVLAEEDEGDVSSVLSWAKAEKVTKDVEIYYGKVKASKVAEVETVEDWMCWVIGGVSSFSYTMFNAFTEDSTDITHTFPSGPLDPLPQVLATPRLDPNTNTLDLTLSTDVDQISQPLDIYLGPIGPLSYSNWRSTSPASSTAEMTSMNRTPAIHIGTGANDNTDSGPRSELDVRSSFPSGLEHVIAVTELPTLDEIVRAIRTISGDASDQGEVGLGNLVKGTGKGKGKGKGKAVDLGLGELVQEGDLGFSDSELALAGIRFDSEQNVESVVGAQTGSESGRLEMGVIDPELDVGGNTLGEMGVGGSTLGELRVGVEGASSYGVGIGEEVQGEVGRTMTLDESGSRGLGVVGGMGVGVDSEKKTVKGTGSLPLLLIRKSDGMGFGTGCGVVVETKREGGDGGGDDGPGQTWVLRLEQT